MKFGNKSLVNEMTFSTKSFPGLKVPRYKKKTKVNKFPVKFQHKHILSLRLGIRFGIYIKPQLIGSLVQSTG